MSADNQLWQEYSELPPFKKIEANLHMVLTLGLELRALEVSGGLLELDIRKGIWEMQERLVSQSLSLLKSMPCYPDKDLLNILDKIGAEINAEDLVGNLLTSAISLVNERAADEG